MKIHFIAVGGSAMHSLAIALQQQGHEITGSDDEIFEPALSQLSQYSILPPVFGWFPEKITPELNAIVLGMHAKANNPELLKAQELGLKIYSYPEFLYEQAINKTRVVIAGSHGKTTITAMVLHVLKFYDFETDYMVGARLRGFTNMVNLKPENDFIILEGDEYLTSAIDKKPKFLHYKPTVALISGISWDHINVFSTFEVYKNAFREFVASLTPGAALIYNEEDENVADVVDSAQNYFRKLPYKTPEYSVKNAQTYLVTDMGDVPLQVFGRHNLQNLEGARLICQQLGIMEEEFYEAIMSFAGAALRMEKVTRDDGALVYRDFAHAPSKVKATSEAFSAQYPDRKKIGFLELHTYSSLQPDFLANYAHTLDQLDEAVIFVSEETLKLKGMQPLTEDLIQQKFAKTGLKVFTKTSDLQQYWTNLDKSESAILLMSSGKFGGLNFSE